MTSDVSVQLMFEGTAEAALQLYMSLFPHAAIDSMTKYGAGEPGAEGSVKRATFHIGDQKFSCIDSPAKHKFTFTPSIAISVGCDSADEVNDTFAKLSDGGTVLMPPANYGFSQWFAWCSDKFGVSWQLTVV